MHDGGAAFRRTLTHMRRVGKVCSRCHMGEQPCHAPYKAALSSVPTHHARWPLGRAPHAPFRKSRRHACLGPVRTRLRSTPAEHQQAVLPNDARNPAVSAAARRAPPARDRAPSCQREPWPVTMLACTACRTRSRPRALQIPLKNAVTVGLGWEISRRAPSGLVFPKPCLNPAASMARRSAPVATAALAHHPTQTTGRAPLRTPAGRRARRPVESS